MVIKKIDNKGQSTIEFIFAFVGAIGFIFLFLKISLNFTDGYMVHHATYMASRSYMAFDNENQSLEDNDNAAFEHSKNVFTRYMPDGLISNVSSSNVFVNHPGTVDYQAFIGLYTTFTQKFSLGFIKINEALNNRSESFLGREPSREETAKQTCKAIDAIFGVSSTDGSCPTHVTLDDNGG